MKITSNCYVAQGLGYIPPWMVNSGIVAGNDITLVIDTGPNAFVAETILGYANAIKPSNKIIAINTEKHLDHIGGNSAFINKGIEVWGHYKIERKKEDLEAEIVEYNASVLNPVRKRNQEASIIYKDTVLKNPTHLLFQETQIDLGGVLAEIYFTPGHTDTNTSIYVPEGKVLYCADALTNEYLPNLEAGNKEDWKTWLTTLDKLELLAPDYIVPGHGPVIKGEEIKRCFERIRDILYTGIERNAPPTL